MGTREELDNTVSMLSARSAGSNNSRYINSNTDASIIIDNGDNADDVLLGTKSNWKQTTNDDDDAYNFEGRGDIESSTFTNTRYSNTYNRSINIDNGNDEDEDELHVIRDDADADSDDDDEYDDEQYYNSPNDKHKTEKYANEKPYQNELNKPVFKSANLEVNMGQAKLYGLLDENGNIKMKPTSSASATVDGKAAIVRDKESLYKHLNKISKPREIDIAEIKALHNDEEATFKPTKNKAALAAMRNPKCGYDFVHRLEENNFMERTFAAGKSEKERRRDFEHEKENYDALLDKLQCPSCKRAQTYLEFSEKRRICSQCNEKFTKLNVFNRSAFEKRMREMALRKEKNLELIDDQVYGNTSAAKNPKPVAANAHRTITTHVNKPEATNPSAAKEQKAIPTIPAIPKHKLATTVAAKTATISTKQPIRPSSTPAKTIAPCAPSSMENRATREQKRIAKPLRQHQESQDEILSQLQHKLASGNMTTPPVDLLLKMAQLQNEKVDILNKAILEAERKYPAHGGGDQRKKMNAVPSAIPMLPKTSDSSSSSNSSSSRNKVSVASTAKASTTSRNRSAADSVATASKDSNRSKSNVKTNNDYLYEHLDDDDDIAVANKFSSLLNA